MHLFMPFFCLMVFLPADISQYVNRGEIGQKIFLLISLLFQSYFSKELSEDFMQIKQASNQKKFFLCKCLDSL